MKKRIFSFLLVVMMLVTMLPVTAFADETEMSDLFKSLLNERGEFVIKAVEPQTQEDMDFYLAEYIWIEHNREYGDVFGYAETYDKATSTCDIMLNGEVHNVKVVFEYDPNVAVWMNEVASGLLEDEEHRYEVKDMELLNFWLYKKGNDSDETGGHTLGNYSGELKAYLENKNVTFEIDNRAGGDDEFVTSRAGMGVLKHNGIAYYYNPAVGSEAKHAFYIPDNTGDTKEEIMKAIQIRFDEYAGEGKVKVVYGGQGIFEYLISVHDAEIARLTAELASAQEILDAYSAQITELETQKAQLEADYSENDEIYITNVNTAMDYESRINEYQLQKDALEMQINDLTIREEEEFATAEAYSAQASQIAAQREALMQQYENDLENEEYLNQEAELWAQEVACVELSNQAYANAELYHNQRMELDPQLIELEEQINDCTNNIGIYRGAADDALYEMNRIQQQLNTNRSELENARNQKSNYEFFTYNPLLSLKDQEEYYKEGTIASYESEDGDYYFLQKAAGDYWFNATIGEDTYSFVAIKDSSKMITPTYASADVNTNITVSSTDTSIPLDTMVSVDKLTSGTEYEKIIKILDVEENETFDITLYSGSTGSNVTKLDNGTFEVKIPVSDSLKGKELVAYYVDEDDKVVEYEVTVKDDCAVFATDHFSIYTIAERKDNTGEGPATSVPEVVAPENNVGGSTFEEKAEDVVEKVPFTAEEKAQIEAGAEVTITLEVKDISETVSKEDKAKVEAEVKEVKDQKVGMYLDVNMFKKVGNNTAVKIPELNGKVKIQFTVPDELLVKDTTKNREYSIIRIHDGETTVLDAKFDATTKTLVFETDSFSTYALVYKDVAKVPQTGDNTSVMVWVMLLAVGGCAVAYGTRKKVVR